MDSESFANIIRKTNPPTLPKQEHLSSSSMKLLQEVAASVKHSVNELRKSQTEALESYKTLKEAISTIITDLEKQQSNLFAELNKSIETLIAEVKDTKEAVSKATDLITDLKKHAEAQQQQSESPWSEMSTEPPCESTGLMSRVQSLERRVLLLAKHLQKLQLPTTIEPPKPETKATPQEGGLPLNFSDDEDFSDSSASEGLQFLFSNEEANNKDKQYKLTQ